MTNWEMSMPNSEVSMVHGVIILGRLTSGSDLWCCIFICMWKVWRKNNLKLKIENWRWKQKIEDVLVCLGQLAETACSMHPSI